MDAARSKHMPQVGVGLSRERYLSGAVELGQSHRHGSSSRLKRRHDVVDPRRRRLSLCEAAEERDRAREHREEYSHKLKSKSARRGARILSSSDSWVEPA